MKRRCIVLAIGAIFICAFYFQQNATSIINWVNTLGLLAPIFFLFIYCLATCLFFPTMILTLAGGAIFGPVIGTIMNLLGATIGAVCAFGISRYLLSSWWQTRDDSRMAKLIHGVEYRGWQFVALLRIVPIIPFNLVNYGLGLTRIKFSHYVLTTMIFLLPIEIISTYFGYASMDLLSHSDALFNYTSWIILAVLATCLLLIKWLSKKQFFSYSDLPE